MGCGLCPSLGHAGNGATRQQERRLCRGVKMSESVCRVLLVEDDPGDASLVRQSLRVAHDLYFEVTWVTSLAEGRQQLRVSQPDVLLLDLSLPDSTGLETVRAGRASAGNLPLIVLTGHDDSLLAMQTLEAGAQDYLVKGHFDTDSLVRAIRHAIGRSRLEQRLAETGTHLSVLINAIPDIICFKDGEGRWLEANDFDLELFQLKGVDYRGKTDADLAEYQDFYRDAFLGCQASDELAWQAGVISRVEEVIPRPDGSALCFDVTKVPLFDEDGGRQGLVVFGRDITERKLLSDRLQQSHDLLAKLSNQVPGIIFQFRRYPDGRSCFPFISQTLIDLYGIDPDSVREDAESIFAFQHPEDAAGIAASIAESARTLNAWHHEYRVILPALGLRWRQGDARPELLDDGSVLWHGFITDITERKRAEAHQRLAARVFDTTGEAIMVTDTVANIVAVNPAFCRITGYSEAEVVGRNPSLLDSEHHDQDFFRAMWATLRANGEWAGEVWNRRKNGEVFPEWQTVSSVRDEAGQVTHYVAIFSDLTEIRRAQEQAEKLSWRDPLTGLANRAMLLSELGKSLLAVHGEQRFAGLLLLDLDRFKDINEARGLAVGDALLRAVASRLSSILHPGDILARLDSDEFAILLPRFVATREAAGRDALAVAEKLRATLREAIELDGETMHVESSIGIALFPDSYEESATDVLRQADTAMHRAKAQGGAQAVFFEAAMGESVRERYRLERELRHAVQDNQLRLYLQPQVDASGRQVGAEALVRWQHPERGLVPPGVFIPLAEVSDLIVGVDRWMLGEVCRLLARLDAEGSSLRVSVNISPRHFQKVDFVAEVKRLLAASGADPTHLVLEITEGLVIGDIADVVAKMTALTEVGIHFSMDDFGTGYSSLAYLKRLPIHELKIDKSFIQDAPSDPNDGALVETILAVAHHLHLQVVAEGVETEAQADFLNARARVIHQGYLFGRPEPLESWLLRWHGSLADKLEN